MSEEQAQQLMQQMQMLETYFSDLSQREGTFLSVLREATAAIESIKSLNQKSDADTLVPIGMGTYVPTKISSKSKIVLNIGAGVAVGVGATIAFNRASQYIATMSDGEEKAVACTKNGKIILSTTAENDPGFGDLSDRFPIRP